MTNNIKLLNYLWGLLLLPTFCLSQHVTVDFPELSVAPDPYLEVMNQINELHNQENLQEIITLKRAFGRDRFDTLSYKIFNSNGTLQKETRYRDNTVSMTAYYTYDENQFLLSWRSLSDSWTITDYQYDDKGNISHTQQYVVRLNKLEDTIPTVGNSYEHTDGRLSVVRNATGHVQTYTYEDGLLISKVGGWISLTFDYENDLITEIREYMGTSINNDQFMGIKKYHYDELGRLTCDSIMTSSNMQKNLYMVNHYEYTPGGHLSQMRGTYDNLYRNANFNYNDGRLSEVVLQSNDGRSAYLRYWINPYMADYFSFPAEITISYSYDQYGNRTSVTTHVNERLFEEVKHMFLYK